MKATELPDTMLKMMSAKDRDALGVQTAEEAMAKFVARNERELQVCIGNLLRLRGIWFYCARTDKRTTTAKGCPDFLFAANCHPIAWEVKHGKGKLSADQERTRDAMIKNGWEWHLVTSVQQAKELLDAKLA